MTTDAHEQTTPETIAAAILASEAFMWLMVGANHVEAHLECLRPAFTAYIDAGGATYGHPRSNYIDRVDINGRVWTRAAVEGAVRDVLNDTEAAPLATQGHVDNLTAEIVAALTN